MSISVWKEDTSPPHTTKTSTEMLGFFVFYSFLLPFRKFILSQPIGFNDNLSASSMTFTIFKHHSIEPQTAQHMKNTSTNREILLMSQSRYFQKDWCELNNSKNDKQLSQKEQLIKLCWNGMLTEIIPEICETEPGNKPLTLWEINESGNMLDLRYGDVDVEMNDEWSINPYVYLTFAIPN